MRNFFLSKNYYFYSKQSKDTKNYDNYRKFISMRTESQTQKLFAFCFALKLRNYLTRGLAIP